MVISGKVLPLSVVAGSGVEHDSKRFINVMAEVKAKYGVGRPSSRLIKVHADQAYNTKEMRIYLKRSEYEGEHTSQPEE